MDQMRFKALFEHSSLGIIITNEEGTIEQSNPFATRIFGYQEGELVGKKVEVLIPPELRERHVHYRNQYALAPHPRAMGSNLNLLAVKKDGAQFPVEISLTYFETDGHKQMVSFINDITVRKNAENQLKKLTEELEQKVDERTKELSDALLELSRTNTGLEIEMDHRKKVESQIRLTLEREKELNEMKSRFVSMASHEFRTPLSGIMTSANLISKYIENGDLSKVDKHILTIKKSIKSLTSILNDFLSIDKLDQGKVSSTPVAFELTKFMNELVEEYNDVSDSGVRILVKHAEEKLELKQDKEMLRNVLINLISNAIKYSPAEEKIEIRSRMQNDLVEIQVQDRGIGISPEDQKHLFERFFRSHNVSTIQGTGLGLNIVKRYLELMGGDISFQSDIGKGTTFKITFPREKKL